MNVSLTWRTLKDGHPICPICQDIDNYTWTFEVGKDTFSTELVHPSHGIVWNIAEGSDVHWRHNINFQCKCGLELAISWEGLAERIKRIADALEGSVAEGTVKADVFR